jgi:pimeloyl-ACP methyl ester carboxylesterase
MPYAHVNGLRLYYEVHGSGPPLVLIHHLFGDSHFTWGRHLPHFAAHYTTVVPDLRGHGRTENPAPRLLHRELAADIAGLVRALEIGPAHLVGVSTGGMALLTLAVEAPELVRRLVISDATYHFKGAELRAAIAAATADLDAFRAATQLDVRHSPVYGPDHWRTLVAEWPRWAHDPTAYHFPPLAALAGFPNPTLILHGDRDEFFPLEIARDMYRAFPTGQLGIIPNAAHLTHAQQPRAWREAVLRFLKDEG